MGWFLILWVLVPLCCCTKQQDEVFWLNSKEVGGPHPGSRVHPFTLPTLHDNTFHGPIKGTDILFHVENPGNLYSTVMVSTEVSAAKLLSLSAVTNSMFVFLTYQEDADAYALKLSKVFSRAMVDLQFTNETAQSWATRLHFVTVSVPELTGSAAFIPSLLSDWLYAAPTITISQYEGEDVVTQYNVPTVTSTRHFSQFWSFPPTPTQIAITTCTSTNDLTGQIALIPLGSCTDISAAAVHALKGGASGLLVFPPAGVAVDFPHCPGQLQSCNGFPLAMAAITHEDGVALEDFVKRGKDGTTSNLNATWTPGMGFLVTYDEKFAELGLFQYPRLDWYGWSAQWWQWRTNLQTKINQYMDYECTVTDEHNQNTEEQESIIVDIFPGDQELGPVEQGGITATVDMPKYRKIQKIVTLGGSILVDLALGCPGWSDDDCPPWDRILRLFVKCDGWEEENDFARWITPYHLVNGRWVTNITPLLPYLNATSCYWRLQTDPWIQAAWVPTVRLVITPMYWAPPKNPNVKSNITKTEKEVQHSGTGPLVCGEVGSTEVQRRKRRQFIPRHVIPMWNQYFWFNQSYNKDFPPYQIDLTDYPPSGKQVKKIEVLTTMTAHGNDNHGCAEFCDTEHVWSINRGSKTWWNYTMIEKDFAQGCTDYVKSGVIPNQYGTWLYGRNTWCPGEQVAPWVVDLTPDANLEGMNHLQYNGYYNGKTPNPAPKQELPAYIEMASHIILYW